MVMAVSFDAAAGLTVEGLCESFHSSIYARVYEKKVKRINHQIALGSVKKKDNQIVLGQFGLSINLYRIVSGQFGLSLNYQTW
jgi:hypothetical protein